MGIEKEYILSLYQDRAKSDGNAKNLANLINSNIHNNLSGDKYLNEILQNVDDAQSPSIEFILDGDYLIVKHQGKHFTREDVEGIVNCADPNREKVRDRDKIGNKGIGFKSVFSLASQVSILSQNYTFKFDEKHEQWKDNPTLYPWQTIPIAITKADFPAHIQAHIDERSVCYVLKIRGENLTEIRAQFEKITPSIMLFLRHVKEIKKNGVKLATLPTKEKVKDKISKFDIPSQKTIYVWEDVVTLPDTLKTKLINDKTIAPKYQTGEAIPLSIAIAVKNEALTPSDNEPQVYCYLPTNIVLGLSFIAHAEFLLDDSRMNLRDDALGRDWNGLILEHLFSKSVEFLSYFNTTELWRGVFNILSFPNQVPDIFKQRCLTAFNNAVKKFPLVHNVENNLALVKDVMCDRQSFVTNFGDKILKGKCLHIQTQNNKVKQSLGMAQISLDDIKKFLTSQFSVSEIIDIEKNIIFLNTLKELSADAGFKRSLMDFFSKNTCIPSAGNVLKKTGEIYVSNENLDSITQQLSFIDFVHPEILKKTDRSWLIQMGVLELALDRLIDEANAKPAHLPHFTKVLAQDKYLEQIYQNNVAANKKEKEDCIKSIKKIKIINEKNEKFDPNDFYLPASFSPEHEIEEFVGENSPYLLGKEYIPDQANIPTIKSFLITMGVQQKITLENVDKLTRAVNKTYNPDKLLRYTRYLFNRFYLNQNKDSQKELLSYIKEIKIITQDQGIQNIEQCYLADVYKPTQELGQVLPASVLLSEDYLENKEHIEKWRDFFKGLGVKECLGVKHHSSIDMDKLKDLDRSFPVYQKLINANNSSKPTLIEYYTQIYFAQHIIGTPFFLKVICQHWSSIKKYLEMRIVNKHKVISSIHYWLDQHIQITHPEKKSSDFYYNEFAANLGPYAQYIDTLADESFTEDQAECLSFKSCLTFADCIKLLAKIAESNRCTEEMNIINFIYEQIILQKNSSKTNTLSLASQNNTFTATDKLRYINNHLFPHSLNPRLIKKPNKFSEENFIKICSTFGVETISFSELTVEARDNHQSKVMASIIDRLPYIFHAETQQRDLAPQRHKEQIESIQKAITERMQTMRFICSDTLIISHKDILNETVDIWIDSEKATIYHQVEMDHATQEILYKFIYKHLKLKISELDFISIMTSSIDKLNKKYNIQPPKSEEQKETPNSNNNNNHSNKKRGIAETTEDEPPQPQPKKYQQSTGKGIFYITPELRSKMAFSTENAVYQALKQRHIHKYGEKSVVEDKDGYTITHENVKKRVNWLNKPKEGQPPNELSESYKSYDFEVTSTKKGKTEIYYREVKATAKDDVKDLLYPLTEWQLMEASTKHKLHIIKVNVNDDQVEIAEPDKILDKIDLKHKQADRSIIVKDMKKITFVK